jgi:hypothetical protein
LTRSNHRILLPVGSLAVVLLIVVIVIVVVVVVDRDSS